MSGNMVSLGRGGAANIVTESQEIENESQNLKLEKSVSNSYPHDKNGQITYSVGRSGASNQVKANEIPSPKLEPQTEIKLTPVFSAGRGGRGNIIRNKKDKSIAQELDDQLSPIHSRKSNISNNGNNSNALNGSSSSSSNSGGFMKKIKKLFN
ncbi:hypothetical protein B5S28_g4485 [[Candida] boidinii]|uniref:Unnamed protein product n=1 Tax=Candida boidinii TaxID=5477 RepID=A0ACB5TQE8_CANBO|nr:hypothetical protein B5S28_g4485 [[Candida] boidinii]OWB63071.1 hypothetical protein B5S29_g4025 [[Candida] boidinii]OWB74761.1 hypothetical protein B5S31_g4580 [[Candida] boidinii]OWB79908.1 hypothetical protein B5S32_g4148 [[Candida] boidinii]GME85144.1 unnamed protein product [[Candida] boidinii]